MNLITAAASSNHRVVTALGFAIKAASQLARRAAPVILALICCIPNVGHATILEVPIWYPTIQLAVDNAQNGDTVLVYPGTYDEHVSVAHISLTIGSLYLMNGDIHERDSVIWRSDAFAVSFEGAAESILRIAGMNLKGSGISGIDGSLQLEQLRIDSCAQAIQGRHVRLYADHCELTNLRGVTRGCALALYSSVALVESCLVGPTFGESATVLCYGDSLFLRDCRFTKLGSDYYPGVFFLDPHGAPNLVRTYISVHRCEIDSSHFHTWLAQQDCLDPQPFVLDVDSSYFHDNEIWYDIFRTDVCERATRAHFFYNVFENNSELHNGGYLCRGLFTLASSSFCTVTIDHNLFLNNHSNESSVAAILEASPTLIRMYRNILIGNSCHDAVANPPGGAVVLIDTDPGVYYENTHIDNHPFAVFCGLLSYPSGHASNCYWGSNSGPFDPDENPGGLGDSVGENIVTMPWSPDTLFLSVQENPAIIITDGFVFSQAYPNPFNSEVTFEFAVLRDAKLRLEVYDIQGRRVATLLDNQRALGVHTVQWRPDAATSGVYFAQLSDANAGAVATIKVLYVK